MPPCLLSAAANQTRPNLPLSLQVHEDKVAASATCQNHACDRVALKIVNFSSYCQRVAGGRGYHAVAAAAALCTLVAVRRALSLCARPAVTAGDRWNAGALMHACVLCWLLIRGRGQARCTAELLASLLSTVSLAGIGYKSSMCDGGGAGPFTHAVDTPLDALPSSPHSVAGGRWV